MHLNAGLIDVEPFDPAVDLAGHGGERRLVVVDEAHRPHRLGERPADYLVDPDAHVLLDHGVDPNDPRGGPLAGVDRHEIHAHRVHARLLVDLARDHRRLPVQNAALTGSLRLGCRHQTERRGAIRRHRLKLHAALRAVAGLRLHHLGVHAAGVPGRGVGRGRRRRHLRRRGRASADLVASAPSRAAPTPAANAASVSKPSATIVRGFMAPPSFRRRRRRSAAPAARRWCPVRGAARGRRSTAEGRRSVARARPARADRPASTRATCASCR